MNNTYTNTGVQTFTITHAKYIASKVATDLKRMQRFYGSPTDEWIVTFESELIEFLKNGYLDTVTYGYKKDGNWIEPTLKYTAKDLAGMMSSDDDPGRIIPNANIETASFYSYLTYNISWVRLSSEEKDAFKKNLPLQRGGADEPGITGYLSNDKMYSSGGKGLERSIVNNY
jgi:Bacterial HORMA domain family 1